MKDRNYNLETAAVVIPSLKPDQGLIGYISELAAEGFGKLIIVDDGSGPAYEEIFKTLKKQKNCVVLTHRTNRGKGAALKTGYRYIADQMEDCQAVLTADSDGQHMVRDVKRVAYALKERPGGLVLGSRDFSLKRTPVKSWIGNRMASLTFFLFYGQLLPDTQTGLRGFGPELLERNMEVEGQRFEYEMQVLIDCIQNGIPIRTIGICSIYKDNNKGTHYRAFKDSIQILRILAAGRGLKSKNSGRQP